MDIGETKKIIAGIICCFPNWKPAVDMGFLTETWQTMLADVTYEDASKALQRYVATDTTGFAPSIGVLRSLVVANENRGGEMSELEAWAIVRKAIGNSGYHYNSEFEKLPSILKRVVGKPINLYHWSQMDSESLGSVEQSHFIKAYRSAVIQEKEYRAMPEGLRDLVALPDISQTPAGIEEKTEERTEVSEDKMKQVFKAIEEMRRKML